MTIRINEKHPDTIKFLWYVVKTIAETENLKQYQIVPIMIEEGKTPFPKFERYDHGFGPDYDAQIMAWKAAGHYDEKLEALSQYFLNNLKGVSQAAIWEWKSKKPLTLLLSMNVIELMPLYKHYQQLKQDVKSIKFTAKKSRPAKQDKSNSRLYLDPVGNLWREPRSRYCYEMGQKSNRHKILRYLTENKGYQSTDDIARLLGGTNHQNIRTEIGKIKEKAENLLGIKGLKVIEARQGSGYRINPKYSPRLVSK